MQPDTATTNAPGKWRAAMLVAPSMVLLTPLVWFAYLGTFSRYMADDYCFAAALRALGFVGNQVDFYLHWSGRFSAFLFVNLASLPGPWVSRVVPSLLVSGLIVSLSYLYSGLIRRVVPSVSAWPGLGLAAATGYLLLEGVPNLFQSLYWLDGSLVHTLPLIGSSVLAGAALWVSDGKGSPPPRWLKTIGLGMAAFLVGGFNEILTGGMVFGLALLFAGDRLLGERVGGFPLRPLAAMLAGSGLALAAMVLAPGNRIRRAEYPVPPDFLFVATTSVKDAGHFIKDVVRSDGLALAGVLLASACVGLLLSSSVQRSLPSSRKILTVIFGVASLVGVFLVVLMLPVEYATLSYPSQRALTTMQFVLSVGTVIVGALLGVLPATWRTGGGRRLRFHALMMSAAIVMAVGVTGASLAGSRELSIDMQAFAASWDKRDTLIRASVADGVSSMSVPSLSSMGTLEELKFDPDDWVNVCVARYYGLDRVYAK